MLRICRFFSTAKDTCLKQLHVAQKGKIVDFAGTFYLILQDTIFQFTIQKESSRSTFTAAQVLLFSMSATWESSSLQDAIESNYFSAQQLETQAAKVSQALHNVTSLCSSTKKEELLMMPLPLILRVNKP